MLSVWLGTHCIVLTNCLSGNASSVAIFEVEQILNHQSGFQPCSRRGNYHECARKECINIVIVCKKKYTSFPKPLVFSCYCVPLVPSPLTVVNYYSVARAFGDTRRQCQRCALPNWVVAHLQVDSRRNLLIFNLEPGDFEPHEHRPLIYVVSIIQGGTVIPAKALTMTRVLL